MLESDIILRIQHEFTSPTSRGLIGFCARWVIYFFIPFAVILRKVFHIKDAIILSGWTALLAFAISSSLAAIIGRVRPYLAGVGIEAIVPPNIQSGSFPSSHTAVATGVAVILMTMNVPSGILAICLALLVGFGRVAAGMHYPTDVVGGMMVGILSCLIVRLVQRSMSGL